MQGPKVTNGICLLGVRLDAIVGMFAILTRPFRLPLLLLLLPTSRMRWRDPLGILEGRGRGERALLMIRASLSIAVDHTVHARDRHWPPRQEGRARMLAIGMMARTVDSRALVHPYDVCRCRISTLIAHRSGGKNKEHACLVCRTRENRQRKYEKGAESGLLAFLPHRPALCSAPDGWTVPPKEIVYVSLPLFFFFTLLSFWCMRTSVNRGVSRDVYMRVACVQDRLVLSLARVAPFPKPLPPSPRRRGNALAVDPTPWPRPLRHVPLFFFPSA